MLINVLLIKKACKFSFKPKTNLVIQYNYSFDFKMQMKQSCKHKHHNYDRNHKS